MHTPLDRIQQRVDRSQTVSRTDALIDYVTLSQAVVVADYGNISRAAQALGVRQSAISRRIQTLENEIGVSLFERHPNGVRLTIAGRRFFERTHAAFAEIDDALKKAAAAGRGDEGMIRVGILPSLISGFLSDLIGDYRMAQPKVAFDFFEGSAREQISRIMQHRLDIAFVVEGMPVPGCDIATLWTMGMCIVLPEKHPLMGCEAIEWGLLKDEHFVVGREAISSGFDNHAADRLSTFGGRHSLERHDISQSALMRLVALGFGLGLVSESSTEIRYPRVVIRPFTNEGDRVSYCAIWLPGNDNPALRRFLSLARSMTAERRAAKAPKSTRASGRSLAPSQNRDHRR